MDESYESRLTFPQDGKQGHYYVERYDTAKEGRIHVIYTTESNSLEVDCINIKVLRIYCREMYDKKAEEVFKRDPELDSNYYKTYFITRDHFHVHVYTQQLITQLAFIDTPIPYNVTVNGQEWWLTDTNYTYNDDGNVFTNVPPGHNYVDLYFKSNNKNSPVAQFTTSKTIIGVGESITFNASSSFDSDGEIISYAWDFGDGNYKGNPITQHLYSQEGNYKVILTVTDDDYLIGRTYKEITVVQRIMSVSIVVDKPIATPGSILTYTIQPTLNTSWTDGVKDIVVTDILPAELSYQDATPLPSLTGRTLSWKINLAFNNNELPTITLQTMINENVTNNTIISNFVSINYKGIDEQEFPTENSKTVNTKVNVASILAPRIRERISDIQLLEDAPPFNLVLSSYEYDFQDSAQNLNWYITEENESLYLISGENSENDIITITPQPDMFGNSLVTLWLIDSDGYTTNQPLWINITPVNDNPIFSDAPDLIVHYNEPYTFSYEPYISDIDTPMEYLQLLVSENGEGTGSNNEGDINIDAFKVTYNFPESYVDRQVLVSLVVFDGVGSDGDNIRINITKDYTPKLSQELPDVLLEEGETKENVFDIDDYFIDPDGDSLFYSFGETYVSIQINVDHTVDITAPPNWNGVDTVTFRARDPMGAIAEDTILVTVVPVNDPPVISGVPDMFIVHYDEDYSFNLVPYVSDEDNEIEDLFLILVDTHIRTDPLNPLKMIMNYPESMLDQELPVVLVVSDGRATGSETVTVKVTDNWPPEIVKDMEDITFYEDEKLLNAFNLNDYYSDKDSNTLFYSYGQEFVNISINPDGRVDFSAYPNWHGVETVTFRATDLSEAFVECVITVSVLPVNDPPVIQPIPAQSGFIKQLWKIDLTEYIEDIDHDYSDLIITVNSFIIDIMVSGEELLIYSDRPIEENVTITISDGVDDTSGSLFIKIIEESSKPAESENFLLANLWLLILIIIIIISITGFAAYRNYVGNYRVEEVFWINNNGILLSHVTSTKSKHRADEFVVSSMLTAIVNFTQDAFSDEEKDRAAWGIKEIQMDEKNILVERGKYSLLATVFTGKSGKRLYSKSGAILRNVEEKHKEKLKGWDGNLSHFKGAKIVLDEILPLNTPDDPEIKK